MVGNLNVKGGLVLDAGPFGPFGPGPRYNFAQFPGRAKPTGVPLSRSRFPYEKTSESKRKLEQDGTPYPPAAPWYQIGRAHVGTQVTDPHLESRLLLEKKNTQ